MTSSPGQRGDSGEDGSCFAPVRLSAPRNSWPLSDRVALWSRCAGSGATCSVSSSSPRIAVDRLCKHSGFAVRVSLSQLKQFDEKCLTNAPVSF